MKNELIEALKEIFEYYDKCNDGNNYQNDEVMMWRRRYVESFSKDQPPGRRANAQYYLLSSTSADVCAAGPEMIVETANEIWDRAAEAHNGVCHND